MPCATSGKDGSLNFNSVMMLKQIHKKKNHLWLDTGAPGLNFSGKIFDCEAFTSASVSASSHRCIAASSPTDQTKNLEEDGQEREVWKITTVMREQLQWIRTTGSHSLTFFFSCLIQKKSQTIGWNSKGDSCSDLHGVYADDFTILIGGEMVVHQYAIKHNISCFCYSVYGTTVRTGLITPEHDDQEATEVTHQVNQRTSRISKLQNKSHDVKKHHMRHFRVTVIS